MSWRTQRYAGVDLGQTTQESELCSQVSRAAPVSVRNLVRQATVHLAGEDETTEQKTEFWITVIAVNIFILFVILTGVGVFLVFFVYAFL